MLFRPAPSSAKLPSVLCARRKGLSRLARRLFLESLEGRDLMALMPYGATADDLGEFMLGDVTVSVVLMESTGTVHSTTEDVSTEDWSTASINAVKGKIEEGVNWWKDTLHKEFPGMSPQLLNFQFDYTFADAPAQTKYEPISRTSSDAPSWIKDFTAGDGVSSTGNPSIDVRLFNNHQRMVHQSSWAFTIFVVNDEHDIDHSFASPGYAQGFAFYGDKYMVVPASRPASSFAHETGHMFYAFDEYAGGDSFSEKRGYYNTQNLNAADNPMAGVVQRPSIMTGANDQSRQDSYDSHTLPPSTMAIIGWQDTDQDNIFDVLDVPFKLEGSGWYDTSDSTYKFLGSSAVRTLFNQNSDGLGNDITINAIRDVQYSVDGSDWASTGVNYNAYMVDNLQVSVPVDPGTHLFKLRTVDTITGAMSPEYVVQNSEMPGIIGDSPVQGFVWWDTDQDGVYDANESPVFDFPVQLVDPSTQQPLVLNTVLDPDDYAAGTSMFGVSSDATFTVDSDNGNISPFSGEVRIQASTTSGLAGNVFAAAANSSTVDTFNIDTRALRVDFDKPVPTVSIRVWGGGTGNTRGRLEAYDSAGNLLDRVTTDILHRPSDTQVLTVSNPLGNIAYIKAGGDLGSYVVLDEIDWGPLSKATTNGAGAFWMPNLAPGTYDLQANTGPYRITTTPASGHAQVDVSGTGSQTINFGLVDLGTNPWHNPVRDCDVNDSGGIDISDLLIQIRYYNLYPNHTLPSSGSGDRAFVDIDGDGLIGIGDILQVIHAYNIAHGGGQSGGSSSGETYNGGDGSDGQVSKVAVVSMSAGESVGPVAVAVAPQVAVNAGGAPVASASISPFAAVLSAADEYSPAVVTNDDDSQALWSQQVPTVFTNWDRSETSSTDGDAEDDGSSSGDESSGQSEALLECVDEPQA